MEWFFKRLCMAGGLCFVLITELTAQPKTNLDKLSSLADNLIKEFVAQLDSNVTHLTLKRLAPEHELNWLFEKIFIDIITNSDRRPTVSLFEHAGKLTEEGLIIEYMPVTAKIQYRQTDSQSTLLRMIEISLFLRLLSSMQDVLAQRELSEQKFDTIDKQDVQFIENKAISFTIGTMMEVNKEIRMLKPLIVGAAAGTIVYLFFSLRSR